MDKHALRKRYFQLRNAHLKLIRQGRIRNVPEGLGDPTSHRSMQHIEVDDGIMPGTDYSDEYVELRF